MAVRSIRGVIALIIVSMQVQLLADEGAVKKTSLPIDKKFFMEFSRLQPVLRDDFLESRLNSIVLARGLVTSIQKNTRLKKKYLVILTDSEAERLNIKIQYHLYIDSTVTITMLQENRNLEFSGQLIAYTPINSKRDAYIMDIVFEKGAVLIE